MFYTYVLQSLRDGSYYIGQTNDLVKRITRHNLGHGKFTRPRAPYKLIYYESFTTRSEAMKREREIKQYKGGQIFKNLLLKNLEK